VASMRDVVMVVDDDPGFREFVRRLLERAGFSVLDAADAEEALELVAARVPQLVLLDVQLPRVSGYELFRELRDRCGESLPVIFVSGVRTDSYDRVAGIMLGAEDYLVKPFDPDELLVRVRRTLRSHSGNSHAVGTDTDASEAIEELTPREREVLVLIARGRSSAQIASELVISPRTVGTHIQHILAKLGVDNRTQAAALAHRAGLIKPDVLAHRFGVDGTDQAANSTPVPARFAS
jgi:DNA-binding NarL/FixJ family response regulator